MDQGAPRSEAVIRIHSILDKGSCPVRAIMNRGSPPWTPPPGIVPPAVPARIFARRAVDHPGVRAAPPGRRVGDPDPRELLRMNVVLVYDRCRLFLGDAATASVRALQPGVRTAQTLYLLRGAGLAWVGTEFTNPFLDRFHIHRRRPPRTVRVH